MTAAEIGKGQEMTDNEFAIRESECNSSAESYFEARPFLLSQHCYRIFDAGFERGWQAALAAPDYPLPDSLYPNSKDWLAGDYADRVEWLHMMYESKRQEVEALLAAPQPAAPVRIGSTQSGNAAHLEILAETRDAFYATVREVLQPERSCATCKHAGSIYCKLDAHCENNSNWGPK